MISRAAEPATQTFERSTFNFQRSIQVRLQSRLYTAVVNHRVVATIDTDTDSDTDSELMH